MACEFTTVPFPSTDTVRGATAVAEASAATAAMVVAMDDDGAIAAPLELAG